ncbi:MAG: hypothetical protein JW852_05910 [Spirochaetales bacterium]|nr:hypothetical protein [Spirochaetales bacterium]
MKNAPRLLAVLLVSISLSALLASCIDIVADVEINNDGSGSIRLAYTAARALVNMGTIDEEDRFYAVPISEQDFLNSAEKIDGLSLRTFDLKEDVDNLQIEAVLDFDSVEALSALFSSSGPGAVDITTEGGVTVYRQVIYGGSGEEIDDESRDFIETFFSEYSVVFSVDAPAEIKAVNLGEFSRRAANLRLAITDILLSPQPVVWEVRW